MQNITFQPLIPPALLVALVAAATVLLFFYLRRRPAMISPTRWITVGVLMACAFATVTLLLLNPTRVETLAGPTGKPALTLLLDGTGSMATPDAAGGKSRFAAASEQARTIAERLGDRFDVKLSIFKDGIVASDLNNLTQVKPESRATDLAGALVSGLREERTQGQAIVLLSDGGNNSGSIDNVLGALRLARSVDTPIFTSTLGQGAAGFNLALDLRTSQDLSLVRQRVPIWGRISHPGIQDISVEVSLLLNGHKVEQQSVRLTGTAPVEVCFWVSHEKTGIFPYEMQISPLQGQLSLANNSASYMLRVIDEPIRVLLLEGKPYWDSKFLVRTLSSVPAVELDGVTQIAPGRLIRRTFTGKTDATETAGTDAKSPATQPTDARLEKFTVIEDAASVLADRAALKRYQIIVLGRQAEPFLTGPALDNLQNWISRDGGSLLCYRGPPTAQPVDRLSQLLPVRWTPGAESHFRIRLTDDGRSMHWIAPSKTDTQVGEGLLAQMPSLASAGEVTHAKPLAIVLARSVPATGGDGAPVLVYQPYGSGRVVVIEGAGMWRWAFLAPQHQHQEQLYETLWHSMLRWITTGTALMPGQKMTLRADKTSFDALEPATATLLLRDDLVTGKLPAIDLIGPDPAKRTTFNPTASGEQPGMFKVNFDKLAVGRYEARITTADSTDEAARIMFDVRSVGLEFIDNRPRPDLMARIAADTDGRVLAADFSSADADAIAQHFAEHRAKSRPPITRRTTVWDRSWVLVTTLGLWACSWAVRRRSGLI